MSLPKKKRAYDQLDCGSKGILATDTASDASTDSLKDRVLRS